MWDAHFEVTRWIFLRGLSFIYLMAFLNVVNQFRGLLGDRGILPARLFIEKATFKEAPSLFHLLHGDRVFQTVGWVGVILSALAFSGVTDHWGFVGTAFVWALMWVFYLSFVNIGQIFYGFGWESMLLETGFLAIFLGPADVEASAILMFLVRWILFRTMFGAGLIKLRGDKCWWNLTCLHYHYETQPIPNPFSWYFHRMPGFFHKGCVLFTHWVELIVPVAYFMPAPLCYIAGGLTLYFQVMLIISGNLSWLNYLTAVLAIPCFDDTFWGAFFHLPLPEAQAMPLPYYGVVVAYAVFVVLKSLKPVLNLISRGQVMNYSFDRYHLVNTYGAFGSITKTRMEVIVEGANDLEGEWKPYEFKGKPGDVRRRPCFMSPYHFRLDWLMWFAAMKDYRFHPWFLSMVGRFLQGEKTVMKLLAKNPFPDAPPKYIRARWMEYHFSEKGKDWWTAEPIADYLEPVSLDDTRFLAILSSRGWL